jgi:hypothetical protein
MTEEVRTRIEALVMAEETALHSPMSRQERACRKATRDAYRLVLDLLDEPECGHWQCAIAADEDQT